MKTVEFRTEDGRQIARAQMAYTFIARCAGLARRSSLEATEGLLLIPARSAHTIGLRFPIDVVFLDGQLRIVGALQELAPWRIVRAPSATHMVLELQAGRIASLGLESGIPICPCFDDESEDVVRELRPVRDSTHRPRPSSPCITFSLRLPLQGAARGVASRAHEVTRDEAHKHV